MAATTKTWVNNQAPSCEDDDLNGFKTENNNLIEGSGQTLNTGDNQQTHKAVAAYSAVGEFFQGGGVADAYTANAPSPRVNPEARIDGMMLRLQAVANNTGACTLNAFGTGADDIKLSDGVTDPSANDIVGGQDFTVIDRGTHFELLAPVSQSVGDVIVRPTSTVPFGFLECDGSAVNRTTYASLFAVIGTTYGIGDGATTFNIPDLRGEFIRGWDNGRGVDPARSIGSAQAGALESHNHQVRDRNLYPLSGASLATAAGAGALTGNFTEDTGGTETRPRNIAMMYCIKF